MRPIAMIVGVLLAMAVRSGAAQDASGCGMADSGGAESRMGKHHAMMARMDSVDVALDSLTRVMNTTTGTRRMDAMAAVLNLIVAHHREMRQAMHGPRSAAGGMGPMDGMSSTPAGHGGGGCSKMPGAGADNPTSAHQHSPR